MKNKFDEKFIDAIWVIAGGMRAGQSLLQAIELASRECDAQVGTELCEVVRDTKLGATVDAALYSMASRTDSKNVRMFAEAVSLLRESGANLATSIDSIAETVYARQQLASRIKTLTSQAVSQAALLGAMPFVIFMAMFAVAREHALLFFKSPLGLAMLLIGLLLWGSGLLCVLRILRVRNEI